MRIIFMGNPDFAVPSLQRIHENFEVVGVVTGPDRLGGRGRKELIESPVKKLAIALGIPVLQPEKLRAPDFLDKLQALKADIQVVVAFRMLPEIVWSMPPMGTINLHSSLLPAFRGAAPINWAIIRGKAKTGLTTFQLQKEIDTGDIYLTRELSIGPDETAGELHDRMMNAGAELLVETLRQIKDGTIRAVPQPDSGVSSAPKIFYDDAAIDPGLPIHKVHDFVRGMSPYPGGWLNFEGSVIKVLQGIPLEYKHKYPVGQWVTDNKQFLGFTVPDGIYKCKKVQLAGKRAMTVGELMNGLKPQSSHIQCDDIFGKLQ